MSKHQVCLMLGSNIEPEKYIPDAVNKLSRLFPVAGVSDAWETPAVGLQGPNFINAAVLLQTYLDPACLKEKVLRPLERRLGRVRNGNKYAPRTIDIDIVTWDDAIVDDSLWNYAHLAVPVAELLPCFQSEMGEYLEEAAQRLSQATPVRIRPEVMKKTTERVM